MVNGKKRTKLALTEVQFKAHSNFKLAASGKLSKLACGDQNVRAEQITQIPFQLFKWNDTAFKSPSQTPHFRIR